MRVFKSLITLAALACSTSAYAANFVEYVFKGSGSGYTKSNYPHNGTDNFKYYPTVFYTATYYVSLVNGNGSYNIGSNSGVAYVGNGLDNYHSWGPGYQEETNVSLFGNTLSATDLRSFYRDYSSTNVSAFFSGTNLTFSDIPAQASFTNGTFTYTFGTDSDSGSVSGTLDSLTVRAVDGPGYVGSSFLAVPEPSTWAMMLAGLGMIGFAVRRRHSAVAQVLYS